MKISEAIDVYGQISSYSYCSLNIFAEPSTSRFKFQNASIHKPKTPVKHVLDHSGSKRCTKTPKVNATEKPKSTFTEKDWSFIEPQLDDNPFLTPRTGETTLKSTPFNLSFMSSKDLF